MTRTLSCLSLAAMLVLPGHAAWAALDPEDQKLIDEASCEEIQREFRNYSQAERVVEAEIRKSNAGTAAANVAGIAAFCAGLRLLHLERHVGPPGDAGGAARNPRRHRRGGEEEGLPSIR